MKAGVAKVVAASSASVLGLAESFPTTESHHPYNNRTIYGAAKAFNEGLLRSFADMYGLDYVALRYFNVYGPRMDVYGAYTEVLIRWMERIAAGQPPIIFGDGTQTMDFVHVHDIARANMLAATSDVTDEVFNVASGTETSLIELAQMLAKVMGSRSAAGIRAGAQGQPRAAPAGRHQQGAATCSASRPRSPSKQGLRDLVAWWRRRSALAEEGSRMSDIASHSRRQARSRRARGRGGRRVILSGWVTQGPEVAAFESEFAAFVGAPHACAVSNCTTALHLALLAVGVGPGDEVITVSHSLHRHRQRHSLLRRHAGLRRHRGRRASTSIPALDRGGDHAADQGDPRASTSSACRATSPRSWRSPARRRLAVIEDAACATGSEILWNGEWERIGTPHRRHRLLLLPSAQGHHHRRRRHADHGQSGIRPEVPPVAPARHERARHGAPRRPRGDLRELSASSGFNYRMTDIQAAIGREQLKRLPEIIPAPPATGGALWQAAAGHRRHRRCRSSRPGRAATGRAIASCCRRASISAR